MGIDYSLYLVADAEYAAGRDLVAIIDEAVAGGVTVVQVRGKTLPLRGFLDLCLRAAKTLERRGVPLIVNDRVDVALACGAAGVHLGQDDLPLPHARKVLGSGKIIGLSVNTPDEAAEAERQGADYVAPGPAFATDTKVTGLPVLGVEGIRRIRSRVAVPVVAIGGITAENAGKIIESGADGVAVISAIVGATNAAAAARKLKHALAAASH